MGRPPDRMSLGTRSQVIPGTLPRHTNHQIPLCGSCQSVFPNLSGTGDSQRASRESIRANRFAIETPIFIARQPDSHESLAFPDSRESLDSRESCESIRANHATKFQINQTAETQIMFQDFLLLVKRRSLGTRGWGDMVLAGGGRQQTRPKIQQQNSGVILANQTKADSRASLRKKGCFFFPYLAPIVTLPALQKHFVNIFFRVCLGILHWKMAGIFGEFFLVSVSHETKHENEKFGENSEQNSGQNSARKFKKFGKLSFCNFPDLTNWGPFLYQRVPPLTAINGD